MLSYILTTMNYELIRILIAVIGTSIFSYFDIFKNRNVPDKLLYIFLGISFLFVIIDIQTLTSSLFWGVIMGVIGYLFYRAGQLGGADVILFVSICLLLPSSPSLFTQNYSQMPFILSLLIMSGLFLLLFIILKYLPKLLAKTLRGEIKLKTDKIMYSAGLVLMFLVVSYMLMEMGMGNPMPFVILLGYIILTTVFINIYKDELSAMMSKDIDLTKAGDRKKVEPEDVVAIELMDKEYVKKHNIPKLLTKNELDRLIKEKVKLKVLTDLPPFIPFVLLAMLVLTLLGDPLYYIISNMFFPGF